MNIFVSVEQKQLLEVLRNREAHPLDYGDAEIILDVLYWNYAENNPIDNPKIRNGFDDLRSKFPHLSMQEFDPVFNTVSELCLEHERGAFMDGIRLGAMLMEELRTGSSFEKR